MSYLKTEKIRIIYAAGPGNVIQTYHHWLDGQDDPSETCITYSSQFYSICVELGAKAYVISSCSPQKIIRHKQFIVEHRPSSFQGSSGVLYHLGYIWYGIKFVVSAVRFRASVAIVSTGTTHWFILSLLPLLGIRVIPSLHCVLWKKYLPKRKAEKLFLRLSQRFFSKDSSAILTVSKDVSTQISQLTAGHNQPIFTFLPVYRRTEFKDVKGPSSKFSPFHVLFAGRIERDKGVFDLLEVAKNLLDQQNLEIIFDICGQGSALESLRLAAQQAGVDSFFLCHGHCQKNEMHKMFNQSHVVVVPTRTDFIEGFNKVVAEGILFGRPVITSSVCPALSYVRNAVIEVPPNDIPAYTSALLRLCHDQEFYEEKVHECLKVQEQFYDTFHSWGFVLTCALTAILIAL